jgi:hypothetical protein
MATRSVVGRTTSSRSPGTLGNDPLELLEFPSGKLQPVRQDRPSSQPVATQEGHGRGPRVDEPTRSHVRASKRPTGLKSAQHPVVLDQLSSPYWTWMVMVTDAVPGSIGVVTACSAPPATESNATGVGARLTVSTMDVARPRV